MRKFLLFWFLLALLKMDSQNLNIAHHSYIDAVSNLISINSNYFYTERILSPSFGDSTNLVGLNSAGRIIFKINFGFNESNFIAKVIKTLDNCLLVVGNSNGCDYDVDPENFIFKVDTNGVVKFQTFAQNFSGWFPYFFVDCSQHADSSYYFVTDSTLHHYSKTGQYICKLNSGIGTDIFYSNAMSLNNNGSFLINGMDTNFINKNIEISSSGSVIAQHIAGQYTKLLPAPNSQEVFGLNISGTIDKINSSLSVVGSTSIILPSILDIRSFTLKGDSIFFTGIITTSNIPVYGILNHNLNLLYLSQSSYKKIYPTGIAIDNRNKIGIIANATSLTDPTNYFISFYQFPLTGNFLSTPDIGVQNFTVISSSYIKGQASFTTNLNVEVKNYTNDTIKIFYLNAETSPLICGYSLFHKFYKTPIPPYGSVTIQTGDFENMLFGSVYDSLQNRYNKNVCIFTTVPNQQSDAEINNDAACITVAVINKEITKIDPVVTYFKIFPNPFNNKLNVESEVEIKKLTLFNAIGQIIKEFLVNKNTASFDNSDLPVGIYFLRVETNQGTQIKKVIKN